jgi:membrane-bound lytic murein transglycosylase D
MKRLFYIMFCIELLNFNSLFSQWDSEFMKESRMVIGILDSLLSDFHFKVVQKTREDSMNINRYNFPEGFIPTYSPEVYRERIKEICSLIPLTYNEDVQKWIDLYTVRLRNTTPTLLGLQYVYFPIIEEIFDREGLPLELKYLAVVESAFRMNATSFAGAVGLWQFILSTAKERGMRIDSYIDERRDPFKSTVFAAKYLKDLYKIYNDWLLAIAAYNSGPGTVNRAIRLSGGKTNFWEIKQFLPMETRSYVPAFIAVAYVFNYPAEHNLYPVWTNFTYNRDTIHVINKQISLKTIAEQTGADLQELKDLNPELKIGVIPYSTKPYILRVPSKIVEFAYQNPGFFTKPDRNEIASQPTYVSNTYQYPNYNNFNKTVIPQNSQLKFHQVKAGETLAIIADLYSISLKDLMAWNNLKNYNIYVGQNLKIYTKDFQAVTNKPQAVSNPPVQNKNFSQNNTSSQTITKKHIVQNGDTLWGISQKYKGLTIERLCEINKINTKSKLYVGQTLIVEEKK